MNLRQALPRFKEALTRVQYHHFLMSGHFLTGRLPDFESRITSYSAKSLRFDPMATISTAFYDLLGWLYEYLTSLQQGSKDGKFYGGTSIVIKA
jgi:hypothetical protein